MWNKRKTLVCINIILWHNKKLKKNIFLKAKQTKCGERLSQHSSTAPVPCMTHGSL